MMILSAVLLLFLASMLHGWYAGHAAVPISHAAYAFMFYTGYIAGLLALSLIAGLGFAVGCQRFLVDGWWRSRLFLRSSAPHMATADASQGCSSATIPSPKIDLMAAAFGGAGRNRTADRGFADLGLTTWRPRRLSTSAKQNLRLPRTPLCEKPSPGLRGRQISGAGDGI